MAMSPEQHWILLLSQRDRDAIGKEIRLSMSESLTTEACKEIYGTHGADVVKVLGFLRNSTFDRATLDLSSLSSVSKLESTTKSRCLRSESRNVAAQVRSFEETYSTARSSCLL